MLSLIHLHARVVAPASVFASSQFAPGGWTQPGAGEFAASGGTDTAAGKPRALVVDDAPDVTEMMGMLLQLAGYEVVTAYSGPQALEAARAEHFDVLVSDIGMPGMNGYELAARLRAEADYAATPMIAVSGFSMYHDRARALESGFNAFLTKPVSPKELIALIERLRR